MNDNIQLQAAFAELVPTMVADVAHLKSESVQAAIASLLFPERGYPADEVEFNTLIETATALLNQNGYLISTKLAPPHVPFTAAGDYLQQVTAIQWEADIEPLIAGQFRPSTAQSRPEQIITRKQLVRRIAVEKLEQPSHVIPKEALINVAQSVDALFAANGWTVSEDRRLYGREMMPIAADETIHTQLCDWIRSENSEHIGSYHLHRKLQEVVYGRYFSRFDPQHAIWQPVLAHLKRALDSCGYRTELSEHGYYDLKPLAIPDGIEADLNAIFHTTPRHMTHYGWVYEADALENALCRACGYDPSALSPANVQRLLATDVVSDLFRVYGLKTRPRTFKPTDQIPIAEDDVTFRAYRFQQVVVVDPERTEKLDKDGGLPVLAPICVIDSETNQLVMLRMLGVPQSVKANWANLMNLGGRTIYIGNHFVRMRGMKKHIAIKAKLPMGLSDWVLLHKQASVREMNPAEPFYVLTDDPIAIPANFFPMLDKAVPVPMLSTWQAYLWRNGVENGLIKRCADKTYGLLGYRIAPESDRWLSVIQTGLQDGELTIAVPNLAIAQGAAAANGATTDTPVPAAATNPPTTDDNSLHPDDVISTYTFDDAIADGDMLMLNDDQPPTNDSGDTAPLFPTLGRTVITTAALSECEAHGFNPGDLLARHLRGDWGDIHEDDKRANNAALKNGTRLFSAYNVPEIGKLFVITEHDRSATTIMLAHEY